MAAQGRVCAQGPEAVSNPDPTLTADPALFQLSDGRLLMKVLDGTLTGMFTEDTEGAGTLELSVRDYDQHLLLSPLIADFDKPGREVDIKVPADSPASLDVWYRLAQVRKTGRTLNLTFEDRSVAFLRKTGLNAGRIYTRGTVTRIEAAIDLIHLQKYPKIEIVAPEAHKVQAVAPPKKTAVSAGDATRSPGFAPGVALQGRDGSGHLYPMTKDRLIIANRVLAVAAGLTAPLKATLALLEAVSIESLFGNPASGEGTSVGVLQLIDTHGSVAMRRDVERVVALFLQKGFTGRGGAITLARVNPTWTAGQIAQACQGSAHPDRYDTAQPQAEEILAAWSGQPYTGSVKRLTRVEKKYTFVKKAKTTVWDTIGTWFTEVNFRRFCVNNIVYLISDAALMASRPRMTISEATTGVDSIDFDIDRGKPVDKVTVLAHAEAWTAQAGTIIELENLGPADGRWLVASRQRGIWQSQMTITLKRAVRVKKEPIATTPVGSPTAAAPISLVEVSGTYGGTENIFTKVITPFMAARGLQPGTHPKRTPAENRAVGGADGSDHLTTETESYAIDYPTNSGLATAGQLAAHLGFGGWQANSYQSFIVRVGAAQFRVQILWGREIQHGDHIHVGIRRI
jgi:hypothetical protein